MSEQKPGGRGEDEEMYLTKAVLTREVRVRYRRCGDWLRRIDALEVAFGGRSATALPI